MFVFNDFKPFIKGGLLARNFQVTILRGLKDWLCDCLLSLWESTPSLSTFYWQATAQKILPQPSHSLLLIRDGKCRKEVTTNVTEWQMYWHDGKFLGLIWEAAGSDITPWISWDNPAPWISIDLSVCFTKWEVSWGFVYTQGSWRQLWGMWPRHSRHQPWPLGFSLYANAHFRWDFYWHYRFQSAFTEFIAFDPLISPLD